MATTPQRRDDTAPKDAVTPLVERYVVVDVNGRPGADSYESADDAYEAFTTTSLYVVKAQVPRKDDE